MSPTLEELAAKLEARLQGTDVAAALQAAHDLCSDPGFNLALTPQSARNALATVWLILSVIGHKKAGGKPCVKWIDIGRDDFVAGREASNPTGPYYVRVEGAWYTISNGVRRDRVCPALGAALDALKVVP